MRHLKTFEAEYSDEEILDMSGDLEKIGASDWEGWWITEIFKYSDGIDSTAYAIVGDSWDTMILMMLESRYLQDQETFFEGVSTWEEFFEILSDELEDPFDSVKREFKAIKMTPRVLKNSLGSASLLETGKVLKLGREYFSNFDSAIMQD